MSLSVYSSTFGCTQSGEQRTACTLGASREIASGATCPLPRDRASHELAQQRLRLETLQRTD